MKKFVAVFLSAMLMLSLVACSSKTAGEVEESSSQLPETTESAEIIQVDTSSESDKVKWTERNFKDMLFEAPSNADTSGEGNTVHIYIDGVDCYITLMYQDSDYPVVATFISEPESIEDFTTGIIQNEVKSRVLKQEFVEINNRKLFSMDYLDDIMDIPFRIKLLAMDTESGIIMIMLGAKRDKFSDYEETLNAIIDSIDVSKVKPWDGPDVKNSIAESALEPAGFVELAFRDIKISVPEEHIAVFNDEELSVVDDSVFSVKIEAEPVDHDYVSIPDEERFISRMQIVESDDDVRQVARSEIEINNIRTILVIFKYTLNDVDVTRETYTFIHEGNKYEIALNIFGNQQQGQLLRDQVFNSIGLLTESDADLPKADPKPEEYSSGMYKVGEEVPPGEYFFVTTGSRAGYVCVSKDASGDFDQIVYNENFENWTIGILKEGRYVEVERAEFYLLSEELPVDVSDGNYPAGMYKVGLHIPAGEYKLEADEDKKGYVCVYEDASHSFSSIVTNDNFSGQKYIKVKEGQYLLIDRCSIVK